MAPIHPCQPALPLTGWRLDAVIHAASWDSGIGAARAGGRWNRPGRHVVYASLDPSTPLLEVAVHSGFDYLDRVPHVLTAFAIDDPNLLGVIAPDDIPNQRWLDVGAKTPAMLDYAEQLLDRYPFVAIPSAVSRSAWNLLFDPTARHFATGKAWRMIDQFRFGLDPRLPALIDPTTR